MITEISLYNPTKEEMKEIENNPLFENTEIYCEVSSSDDRLNSGEYLPKNNTKAVQLVSEIETLQQAGLMKPMENNVDNNPKIVKETPIHLKDGSNIHEIVSEISRVVGEDMDWPADVKSEYKNTYKSQTRNNDILARAIGDKTARVVGDLMYDVAKSILDTSSMNNAFLSTSTTELYRSLFNRK